MNPAVLFIAGAGGIALVALVWLVDRAQYRRAYRRARARRDTR